MGDAAKKMHEDLRQELITELQSLRVAVRDVGEGFVLRKEGEIEALVGYLLTLPAGKLKIIAKSWLRESRELDIKPAKGRIRDLKRIHTILGDLLNCIIDVDHDLTVPKTSDHPATIDQKKTSVAKNKQIQP